jgi:PST family polysaccharide transporter
MRFLPWLLAGAVVDRLAFMPERVLVRDLRFARVSAGRGLGEVAYGVCALALAVAGWGGMAIVAGNLLRSLVRAAVFLAGLDRREWLEPTRLRRGITRQLFAFGVPLSIAALAGFAARRWDNLLIARFFGASTLGHYNLAYNLADVPAIQVGEHVGDVLLPSFARLDPERRRVALTRALGVLALLVFPLAVGLGAVAPTLVAVLFDPRWQPVGPMLVLLAALSVTRPVGWTVESYLQALGRARRLMALEAGKAALVVLALVTLGRQSALWACAAVGVAFAAHALAALWQVRSVDGIAWRKSLGALAGPLVACVPLVLAVLAVRHVSGDAPGAVRLLGECVAGGVAYVAAAHVVARSAVDELVWRVRDALGRR